MGRKKLTNERFQIRCHPNVIKDVRKYAKERSQEEQQRKKETKYPCPECDEACYYHCTKGGQQEPECLTK